MRLIGLILIVVGCCGYLAALNMDTTVEAGGGSVDYGKLRIDMPLMRVQNFGLMDQRRNYLIVSAVAVVIGAIFFGFGTLVEHQAKASQPPVAGPRCPKCNGILEGTPGLCMHCCTELRWVAGRPITIEVALLLEKRQKEIERTVDERRKNREHQATERQAVEQRAAEQRAAFIRSIGHSVIGIPSKIDAAFVRIIGEENVILAWFVRFFLVILACTGVFVAVLSITSTKIAESENEQKVEQTTLNPKSEQVYAGKTLSKWANQARSNSVESRLAAASALGEIGSPAIPALKKLLHDSDENVKRAAIDALGKIGSPAILTLADSVRDRNQDSLSRVKVINKLGEMEPEAIPALIDLLQDEDKDVRWNVVAVLNNMGPRAKIAMPALTKLLHDKEEDIRWVAAESLKKIAVDEKPQAVHLENQTEKTPKISEQKRYEGKEAKLDCFNLSVGQVGQVDSGELTVLRVMGEKKLLVAPTKKVGQQPAYGTYSSAKAASRAIQDSMTNTHEETGEPLIIYGWSSKGVVDGQKLILSETVEVIGTEQYKTVAGSNKTVFMLKVW